MTEEFDTSKLEKTGWRAFLSWTKEYYHHEFKQLDNKYKDSIIEEVLMNTSYYFSREDVLAENLCSKCGLCCRELHCVYHDYETHLCTRHDNQESKVCGIYPWDDDIGFILTLNCGYQKKYVIKFFNNFFTMVLKMKEGQNE